MKLLKFLILYAVLSLFSCDKGGEVIDITNDCKFYSNILSTCFYMSNDYDYDEIVIRDNDSYQRFSDAIRIPSSIVDCDTAQLPPIDFTYYTLLSKQTGGGGCHATYLRKVIKDTEHKKIIYEIEVKYEGICAMIISNRNWVIVPKIPDDYNIEFLINDIY
jgi:hypothetical protein